MRKILVIIVMFLSIAVLPLQSAMLVPDIYLSGGYNINDAKIKYYNQDSQLNNQTYSSNTNKYQFALGIRPLDIPILGGLRVEGQYSLPASSDFEDRDIGLILYYDFRILPIVTPYLGIGYHKTQYTFSDVPHLSSENDDSNAYSFHAGADFAIPLTGLSVFADYKYQHTSTKAKNNNIDAYGVKDHSLTLGLKYYLLQ